MEPQVQIAVVLVARCCLGLFLLPSALGKLRNRRNFLEGLLNYQILPKRVARVFGFVLPWIELGLALALLLGIALPITGVITILLLISFIIAITINLHRGREIKCNCYGFASTSTISGGTIVRNFLLLIFATTVAGLTRSASGFDQWLLQWHTDILVIASVDRVVLLGLLLAFCFVIIHLVEWGVDIYSRLSHLQISKN